VEDQIHSGYTRARFGEASEKEVQAGYNLTAAPLLTEESEAAQDSGEEPGAEELGPGDETVPAAGEEPAEEPEPEPVITETEVVPVLVAPEPEPEPEIPVEPEPDPDRLVFRVQILSNPAPDSRPTVTISGRTFDTWEYYYKGAYRITVGAFDTAQEASAFSRQCRSSGFNQAFVAAFRGNERETDPSVFRQ